MKTLIAAALALASLSGAWLTTDALAAGDRLPPNELGTIMFFMYHQIKSPERDYVRSAENFRRDLENLYNRGYRLANFSDVVDGKITTEAGRTPVVLTFDDAAFGQINKIVRNGPNGLHEEWDPESAVGIMLEFARKHPDMGVAGMFYVNPFSSHMDRSKSDRWGEWMKEMVELGFEFGNHTATHPNLKKDTPRQEQVEKEVASCQAWIHKYLPNYKVRSMALPFGIYPAQTEWVVDGSYKGETYHHDTLMKVGADPSVSPYSKRWNPLHIARVRAQDVTGDLPVSGYWLEVLDKHPEMRFVSDGDPDTITIPANARGQLRSDLPSHYKVITR
jgi:peptidoglycan/xylan/chitin deacetylase (PgdA/CDA1 family)